MTPPPVDTPATDPIIAPDATLRRIADLVGGIVLDRPFGRIWWPALGCAIGLVGLGLLIWLMRPGFGTDAVSTSAARDAVLASASWWLDAACGCLFAGAVLHLVDAPWRCAIGRLAAIISVAAALVALLTMTILASGLGFDELIGLDIDDLGSRLRLALVTDAAGPVAYGVVAASMLVVGLLPDLSVLGERFREVSPGRARLYRLASRGWLGSAGQWQRWRRSTDALALLAILAVVALETSGVIEFTAMTSTTGAAAIEPVTRLLGALLAGLGLLACLLAVLRGACRLEMLVTERHFDILSRTLLVVGFVALYCHLTELAAAMFGGDRGRAQAVADRWSWPGGWASWAFLGAAFLPIQAFWLRRVRRSALLVGLIGLAAALGTHADGLGGIAFASRPGGVSEGTILQAAAAGAVSLGLFLALMLVTLRIVPIVSIAETRALLLALNPGAERDEAGLPAASEPQTGGRSRGVIADFASEPALATAIRALRSREPRVSLEAYGPVPMNAASEALGRPARGIRQAALMGAVAGGIAYFILVAWDKSPFGGLDVAGRSFPAWPFFVLPSLSLATMTGALAVVFVFLGPLFLPRLRRWAPIAASGSPVGFSLIADLDDGTIAPEWIERRLVGLPDPGARPHAMRRFAR